MFSFQKESLTEKNNYNNNYYHQILESNGFENEINQEDSYKKAKTDS